MADYIDDDSEAKKDLLEFIISQTEPINATNILNFLSRVKPKSKLLLDTCLQVLKDSVSKKIISRSDITAAYLIGSHFKGDKDVLNILLKTFNSEKMSYQLIQTLCFGWPDYPGLENAYEKIKEKKPENPINEVGFAELLCTIRPSEKVMNFFNWVLDNIDYISRQFLEKIKFFIRERVSRDSKLRELIAKHLPGKPSANQKVTYISLLKTAGALNEEVCSWSIDEIERQRNEYESPEIGFDIVNGEYTVVLHVLLEAVSLL